MKKFLAAVMCSALTLSSQVVAAEDKPVAIVIHGGAGTILKKNFTPELEKPTKIPSVKQQKQAMRCLNRASPVKRQ